MDANCVDRPVAFVAGLASDPGTELVHGLLHRGYEVWASGACVPDAGFALPLGRVHQVDGDLDTYLGCEQVLNTLCATRRPIVIAAVSLAGASKARVELVDTLERLMTAQGRGRLPLIKDAHLSVKAGDNALPPVWELAHRPRTSRRYEEVSTLMIAPDVAEASALTELLCHDAPDGGDGGGWFQRRARDVPRPRRWRG